MPNGVSLSLYVSVNEEFEHILSQTLDHFLSYICFL